MWQPVIYLKMSDFRNKPVFTQLKGYISPEKNVFMKAHALTVATPFIFGGRNQWLPSCSEVSFNSATDINRPSSDLP